MRCLAARLITAIVLVAAFGGHLARNAFNDATNVHLVICNYPNDCPR